MGKLTQNAAEESVKPPENRPCRKKMGAGVAAPHRYRETAFLPKAYSRGLSHLIARLREKYGIPRHSEKQEVEMEALHSATAQLSLF